MTSRVFGLTACFRMPAACVLCRLASCLLSFLMPSKRPLHLSIPWRIIKDTRKFYVHAYGSLDVPAVWNTLNEDIPALMDVCNALL